MSVPPPLPPGLSAAPSRYLVLIAPVCLIVAGMALLGVIAGLEYRWLDGQPWVDAVILPEKVLEAPGVVPLYTRQLAPEESERLKDSTTEALRMLEKTFGDQDLAKFAQMEHVIALEMPVARLQEVLSEGRLPNPGTREVLAGALARFETFSLDGEAFKVVGRLRPTASGLLTAYVLPDDPALAQHFAQHADVLKGTLVPEGMLHLRELLEPLPKEDKEKLDIWGGQLPTRGSYTWGILAALILVACGGSIAHVRLFRMWSVRAPEVFQTIFEETLRYRTLFLLMHVALYGIFFFSMVVGLDNLLLNYWMTQYIGTAFQEGSLSYIGQAYGQGNIALAALATFYNNYVVQTLQLTFLISLFPIPLGLLKTALSFFVVGVAMSPVWAGTASGMVFHCITMFLELEAYIVACFAVLMWSIRLLRLAAQGPDKAEFLVAVRMFVGAMVLTGVMLAIAALYEAASLILLRPLV